MVEYDGASGVAEGKHVDAALVSLLELDPRPLRERRRRVRLLRGARRGRGQHRRVLLGEGLRVFPVEGEPETVPVESADPWGPEIEEFVSCVEQGRQPAQGTGEQASLALRMSLAAARSLESGRPEAI